MLGLISISPHIINCGAQHQSTDIGCQRLLFPITHSQPYHIVPINWRMINIASTHYFFPYSCTVATLKEKVFLAFHPFRQNIQLTSPLYPHFTNRSPIVKQFFIANHMTKACFGMAFSIVRCFSTCIQTPIFC